MRLATLSLLASSLALQGVVATFDPAELWGSTVPSFQCSCAHKAPEKCTPEMQRGWDFGHLPSGHLVSESFSGFHVSGLMVNEKCTHPVHGPSKCAVAVLERESTGVSISLTDIEKTPTGFSVTSFHLTVTVTVEIEFVYTMTDGSTCRHVAPCGAGFNVVQNQQCGGAVSVKFNVVETIKVEVSIFKIDYECGKGGGGNSGGSSTPPALPSTTSRPFIPGTGTGVFPPPITPKTSGATTVPVVPTSSRPVSKSTPIGTPGTSTPVSSATTFMPSPPVPTGVFPPTYPPVGPTGTPTVPVSMKTSYCPVPTPKKDMPPAPPVSTPPALVPHKSPPAGDKCHPTPGECPPVVPKCLATWIQVTKCPTNTAADCYCTHEVFTTLVIDCINARGCSKLEVDIGMSYFVGICAPHIPKNPAIITHLPPTTNLIPPPTKPEQPPAVHSVVPPPGGHTPGGSGNVNPPVKKPPVEKPPVASVPVTVISIVQTVSVPAITPVVPAGPVPTTPVFVSEFITVPQIHFNVITVTGPHGPVVETGLVPGPQPPAPTPSTAVGTGTFFPTGFRPVITPTAGSSAGGGGAPPPIYTGAANVNNKAGKVVGGMAGGLAALLLL